MSRLTSARRAASAMTSALIRAEVAALGDPQARRIIRDERMRLMTAADPNRVAYVDGTERAAEIEAQMASARASVAAWGVTV